jgi:outer membrane protein assembly factor BamB
MDEVTVTVIELGDPGSPAEPLRSGRRRLPSHAVVRSAAVAAILFCLAPVTGSSRPVPLMIRPAWSVAFDMSSSVQVTRDAVYVLSTGARSQVTARELANGGVRWSVPLPVSRGPLTISETGAVLVPLGPAGDEATTAALDPRTGSQLWRLSGDVLETTSQAALVAGTDATVREVRMADGGTIWSRPAGAVVAWAVADHALRSARLVSVTAGGQVRTVRLADGALLSRGRLPDVDGVLLKDGLSAAGGLLYVNQTNTDRAVVKAYDLDTLKLRWMYAQTASDDVPSGPAAHACGLVMCFLDGTGTVGLESATGRVRWRASGWIDPAPVTGANRLLADSPDHAWYGLLDSSTGRVVATLGAGAPVWDRTGSTPAYYLHVVAPSDPRTAVSRIDPGTGTLALRGMIGPVDVRRCTAAGSAVVCVTADGRLSDTTLG